MLKIAHRGYSSKFKDNSLLSFQEAIQNNFDMIEIDLRLTKENEIDIFHDNYVNHKLIKNMNNNEIKENNILFLKELFDSISFKETKIKLLFDLKGCDDNLSSILYHKLIDSNIDLNKTIIASFNVDYLKYFIQQDFKFNLAYISANNYGHLKPSFMKHIRYFIFDVTILSTSYIQKLRDDKKIIFCYTCHDACEKEVFSKKSIEKRDW